MNIGIDIRVLAKGKRTGVEEYTINFLSHLLTLDKSNKYRLFYSGFRKPKLNYPWLKSRNIKIKKIRIPNRILDFFLKFLKFPKIDRILGGVDIFLSPHFLITPLFQKTKRILIFYDLSFVHFPEFFSKSKLFWHKFVSPKKQAQRADLIISISESTKKDLIETYDVGPEKIEVIYPGVDNRFRPMDKNSPEFINIKNKYGLPASFASLRSGSAGGPDNFILYFGTIEPRKNILGIIRAFEQLKKTHGNQQGDVQWKGFEGIALGREKKSFDFSNFKLVIAGIKGWLYGEVFKAAENSEFSKDILFTGFVEEEDKPYLYNLAEIFVYPSFFEGFGLPPLEAMACGVPVIVSNKSSLPEVVGDAAIAIDPTRIEELVFSIKNILEDKNLKERLINRGLERIKNFKWEKAVKKFMNLIKKYEDRN